MSDVRPNGEGDGAARLLASARARLAGAGADLRLPSGFRLTEWQRTTIAALFAALVRDAEDELRAVLVQQLPQEVPDTLKAALGSGALPIALPLLESTPLLSDPELLPLLLRRAEEHRLAGTAHEQGLVASLAGDEDAGIAGAAMGLLIARNSRFDAFQEPLLGRSDLPADLRHRLLWTVAAALRRYVVGVHRLHPAFADHALATAVADTLPGYDEADGVEARAIRLAGLLAGAGRVDDAFVARAAEEGNLPLLLAALGVRSGFGFHGAWELLADVSGAPLLLRSAEVARPAAGAILFRLGGEAAAGQLDRFDALTEQEVAALTGPWRADAAYRAAIAEQAA